MISKEARDVLTPSQVATIEANPLYPSELSGVSYHVLSGEVEVTFGEVRFCVTPEGRVKSPPAQSAVEGILSDVADKTGDIYDSLDEVEAQIQELQRTVDSLTAMVRMLMTPDQKLRCTFR